MTMPMTHPVAQTSPKKFWQCAKCGACCHIREQNKLSAEEEKSYKDYMKKHFGIFYLASLSEVTINVWPEEAERLRDEAKRRGMDVRIRPKRALVTPNHDLIVMDYFIDHDICPFFDKEKRQCTVYALRPLICRAYPLTSAKTYGKCKYKSTNLSDYGSEMDHAQELDLRIAKEKAIITDLMLRGSIIRDFDESKLRSQLANMQLKELRIKL